MVGTVLDLRAHGARRNALYPATLLTAALVIFTALGLHPAFRQDWLLENMLVLLALPVLLLTFPRFRFSDTSYTFLFGFFVLHEVGAHYTYSQVPYDLWLSSLHGFTLEQWFGFTRNHYDRLVHFVYGMFLMFPLVELGYAVTRSAAWLRYLQALAMILAGSVLYELIEWAAAVVFGGELGVAYLGTQGDQWDVQKDMACALAGALLAIGVMCFPPRLTEPS